MSKVTTYRKKRGRARENSGAIEEVLTIVSNLADHRHFIEFFHSIVPPEDSRTKPAYSYAFGDNSFHFGNGFYKVFLKLLARRLVFPDEKFKLPERPSMMIHLASYNKKLAEKQLGLPSGYLNKCKADLVVGNSSGEKTFYSIKKGSSNSKAGQISGVHKFGKAVLRKVTLDKSIFKTYPPPNVISREDTALTQSTFQTLVSRKNVGYIRFAWLKKNHPDPWKDYVGDTLNKADVIFREFYNVIKEDRESFEDFFMQALRGPNSKIEERSAILISGSIYPLSSIHKFLCSDKYSYHCELYGETSILFTLRYDSKEYFFKAQYSFEGAEVDVSQTKGIVMHIQDYVPKGGLGIWDLVEDIQKNFSC